MKYLLISIILSNIFYCLHAQQIQVSSTEEYTNTIQGAHWSRILGQDESGYYLLREYGPISNQIIALEKYSPALKLLYTTNIEATSGTFNDSRLHRYTEMNNGKIYVFLEGWNKSQQQNSFLVKEVGQDGSLQAENIVLEREPATGQMKSANYKISFSPDGSKLLVLTEKPFVKGGKEAIRLQVFDTDSFRSIWSQDLSLENEAEKYPSNSILLDNQGIAYLFKDIKITYKEHHYQLLTANGQQSQLSPLDLAGYSAGQIKLRFDASGKFTLAGTLVPAGKKDTDWQATWYLQADHTGKILQHKIQPLGAELLQLVVSSKSAGQEGYVLENYALKDILVRPEGGMLMLLEEQRESKSAIPQTVPPVDEYNLYFGNVLIISLDEDGNRVWQTVLSKKQNERTLEKKNCFGSVACQLKDGKLYLVWNNMEIFNDPPLYKYRYWIDRNGSRINIDNLYGKEAFYPTLITVIRKDGSFEYADRTFNALPLETIQQKNAFPMAADPGFFFTTDKGMIILSRMPGTDSKRYKFNSILY